MWKLYDELIAAVPEDAIVEEFLAGLSWFLVHSIGIGVASAFLGSGIRKLGLALRPVVERRIMIGAPLAGIAIALLTNRTWPDRQSQLIRQVRPAFHNAVREAL